MSSTHTRCDHTATEAHGPAESKAGAIGCTAGHKQQQLPRGRADSGRADISPRRHVCTLQRTRSPQGAVPLSYHLEIFLLTCIVCTISAFQKFAEYCKHMGPLHVIMSVSHAVSQSVTHVFSQPHRAVYMSGDHICVLETASDGICVRRFVFTSR